MTTITHDGENIPDAPNKDPDATLDYGFDWTDWLDTDNAETISTSTWILETGITEVSSTTVGNINSVTLSGGTVDFKYLVTNRVTSSAGRIDDRSMYIRIKEK